MTGSDAIERIDFFPSLLARRLRRFSLDDADALAVRAIALMRALLRLLRPGVVADLLATRLNGRCVAARFGSDHPCRFCGTCGPDSIDCLWRCPALLSTIYPMRGLADLASPLDALALSLATRDITLQKVLDVHLVRFAHNRVRSSSHRVSRYFFWRIFLTRFRKLARDSPRERAILLRLAPAGSPPPFPAL